MSNYTDKILAKMQREQKAKETQLEQPLHMGSVDDVEMDFELENIISDNEFTENFFNDEAHGDETQIDLDEWEEDFPEVDTHEELIEKEIKKKKKHS